MIHGTAQAHVVVLAHPLHGPGAAGLGGVLIPLQGQLAGGLHLIGGVLAAVAHPCGTLGVPLEGGAQVEAHGIVPVFHGPLTAAAPGGEQLVPAMLAALAGERIFHGAAEILHVRIKTVGQGILALALGGQHLAEQGNVFGGGGEVVLHPVAGAGVQQGQIGGVGLHGDVQLRNYAQIQQAELIGPDGVQILLAGCRQAVHKLLPFLLGVHVLLAFQISRGSQGIPQGIGIFPGQFVDAETDLIGAEGQLPAEKRLMQRLRHPRAVFIAVAQGIAAEGVAAAGAVLGQAGQDPGVGGKQGTLGGGHVPDELLHQLQVFGTGGIVQRRAVGGLVVCRVDRQGVFQRGGERFQRFHVFLAVQEFIPLSDHADLFTVFHLSSPSFQTNRCQHP